MTPILKIHFENLKPVSTNAIYDGHLKSGKYIKMERNVDKTMMTMRPQVKKFMDAFDEKTHIIKVFMVVHFPKESLFVKTGKRKGCVSKRCLDMDNSIKSVTDAIFYNIPLIDDSQVRKFYIDDLLSENDFFNVTYYIGLSDKEKHYARKLKDVEKQIFQFLQSV